MYDAAAVSMHRHTYLLLLLLLLFIGLFSSIHKTNRELANDTQSRYDWRKQRHVGDGQQQHGYDSKNQLAPSGNDIAITHKNTAPAVMTSVPICTSRQRLDYIRARIATNATRPAPKLNTYILAEDSKRVAFCVVHKCASSTMLRVLMLLAGKLKLGDSYLNGSKWEEPVQRSYGLRRVDQQSLHTIANHRKIVVIRHPLDRLVSAFNQKVLLQNNDEYEYRRNIRDWLHGKHSNATLFQQFTRAVLTNLRNGHWDPYADACHFDSVDYDDVIRLESFRHDFEPVATGYLGLDWSVVRKATLNAKRVNVSVDTQTTVKPRRLPILGEISKNEVRQLKEMYRHDFDLLGYEFDVESLTTSCKIVTSDGSVCC